MSALCGHKADGFQNASQKGAGRISLIQFCFQLALESVPEIKAKVIPDLKDDSVLCGTEIFFRRLLSNIWFIQRDCSLCSENILLFIDVANTS